MILKPQKITDFKQQVINPNYKQITIPEIFNWVSKIRDPEHPNMSLEELKVVSKDCIEINDQENNVCVIFTPTTPNCSMGAIIGLAIKVLLMRILPLRFRISVRCREDTHDNWRSLNKQINDKERVLAAMTNPSIMTVIEQSIAIEELIDE